MATKKKKLKNPHGGLTAAGRAFFKKKDGANLRPGVKGKADTVEKQKRKGSFLTRMFTHPRGPMVNEDGSPTRLALSAYAWGESVPKTIATAKKLAAKGRRLLELAKNTKIKKQVTQETIMAKKKKKKVSKKAPGLYANIHKAQEREKHGGAKVRKKGEKGSPTAAAFNKSEKTAKKKKTKS